MFISCVSFLFSLTLEKGEDPALKMFYMNPAKTARCLRGHKVPLFGGSTSLNHQRIWAIVTRASIPMYSGALITHLRFSEHPQRASLCSGERFCVPARVNVKVEPQHLRKVRCRVRMERHICEMITQMFQGALNEKRLFMRTKRPKCCLTLTPLWQTGQ